jgi:hypothetical protein
VTGRRRKRRDDNKEERKGTMEETYRERISVR